MALLKRLLLRSPILLVLPFLVVIAGFQGRNDQIGGLFLWTIASFSIGQAAAILGPVGAGLAAFLAGRNARNPTRAVFSTMPGRGASVHFGTLIAAIVWVVVAWSIYIGYQIGAGIAFADWGFLEFVPVLAGLAILLMTVSVGYTLGVLFPGRFTPLVVGTGMLLLFMLLYLLGNDNPQLSWLGVYSGSPGEGGDRSFKYLSPMQIFSGSVSTTLTTSWGAIGPRFIGWMLGLFIAAVGILCWWLRIRLPGVVLTFTGAIAAVAAAAALISLPASVMELPREQVAYEEVCAGDLIMVCVHPAYQQNLNPTLDIAEGVLGPVHGLPGVPSRIDQFGVGSGGDRVYQIYFEDNTADAVAMDYLGVIYDLSGGELSPGQSVIGYWLFTRSIDDPDGYWLRGWLPSPQYFSDSVAPPVQLSQQVDRWKLLSETEQRAWLEANWTPLINGQIGWDDLP